jgi:hypothetical protein
MTAPVNRASAASAIAALLRQAVAAHAQPSMRRARGTSSRSGKASASGEGGASKLGNSDNKKSGDNSKSLGDLIAARIKSLDPDASDYRSRQLRLVIEASLLYQFGSSLMNAPKFQSMVDQILHELESAPQLKRDVDAVLKGLS